jgi:hypothetical protein
MHVGIQIQIEGERNLLKLIRLFNEMAQSEAWKAENKEQPFPMPVMMPCGYKRTIMGPEDFPLEDLKCPCKDPDHWIVRWA